MNAKDILKLGYCCWLDDDTFVISVAFSDLPQAFLNKFNDVITAEDMNEGYLSCEYWADCGNCVYNLVFDDDTISVGNRLDLDEWNAALKNMCCTKQKESV